MSLVLLLALAAADSLALPLADAPSPVALAAARRLAEPPVRVTLNNDRRFRAGERAKVQVESADDGYLWVLQVDTDGRLRVLFPLDPDDDNYVRGGRRYELRGRGGREAFTAEGPRGTGFVYAVWSRAPHDFAGYTVNAHWDYRTLAPRALAEDPEAELNDLAAKVVRASYEYDLLSYAVRDRNDADVVLVDGWRGQPVYAAYDPWWRGGWCSTAWYGSAVCDPWRYGAWGGSFVGFRVGGVGIGVGSWYDPWWGGGWDPYWNAGWDPYWNGWGWNGWGWNDPWRFNRGWWGGPWYGRTVVNNYWYGYPRGGWSHGWRDRGWNGGWRDYRPVAGADLKGRSRTWGGRTIGNYQPPVFRAGGRTDNTVYGRFPTRPDREVNDPRGLGRRSDPIGVPADAIRPGRDAAVGRVRPEMPERTERGRRPETDGVRPEGGRGADRPEAGRGADRPDVGSGGRPEGERGAGEGRSRGTERGDAMPGRRDPSEARPQPDWRATPGRSARPGRSDDSSWEPRTSPRERMPDPASESDEGRRGGRWEPRLGPSRDRGERADPGTAAEPRYERRRDMPAPQSEPRGDWQPERRAEPRSEPRAEPRYEPRRESRPEPRYEPRRESRPEPRSEPRRESRAEPRYEPRAEPRRESPPPRSNGGGGGGGRGAGEGRRRT